MKSLLYKQITLKHNTLSVLMFNNSKLSIVINCLQHLQIPNPGRCVLLLTSILTNQRSNGTLLTKVKGD